MAMNIFRGCPKLLNSIFIIHFPCFTEGCPKLLNSIFISVLHLRLKDRTEILSFPDCLPPTLPFWGGLRKWTFKEIHSGKRVQETRKAGKLTRKEIVRKDSSAEHKQNKKEKNDEHVIREV
jgi:hypothetical protein